MFCAIGKSTMLSAIGQRELPIPDHIDIFHLTEEYTATDKTALEAVIEVRIIFYIIEKYKGVLIMIL